jgi:hypothetical protein
LWSSPLLLLQLVRIIRISVDTRLHAQANTAKAKPREESTPLTMKRAVPPVKLDHVQVQ